MTKRQVRAARLDALRIEYRRIARNKHPLQVERRRVLREMAKRLAA